MIARLLRRLLEVSEPEDGLAETLAITIRCARRCAYDLSHAADLLPDDKSLAGSFKPHFAAKADHWQGLFSSGASMKDYRLRLHSDLDEQVRLVERLRAELKRLGHSGFLDNEVPF